MKSSHYQKNWQGYWSKLVEDKETAVWDVLPNLAVVDALPYLQNVFDKSLPLIDFGCGNGTQSFFLAKYCQQVIGVDVAEAAIKQAQLNNSNGNLSFEVLDGTHILEAKKLHQKIGDANIYMRSVLHQIGPEDRSMLIQSLQTLMGKTGQLYLSELSPKAQLVLEDIVREVGEIPPLLKRVYNHGIKPAEIQPEEILAGFTDDMYTIVEEGQSFLNSNYILPNGNRFEIPAFYMLIRPKQVI